MLSNTDNLMNGLVVVHVSFYDTNLFIGFVFIQDFSFSLFYELDNFLYRLVLLNGDSRLIKYFTCEASDTIRRVSSSSCSTRSARYVN